MAYQKVLPWGMPRSISAGDLNGDGKPNMIVSNQGSNNVSVLRNASTTGNLLLDTHVDYNVDPDPFFLAIADLDKVQNRILYQPIPMCIQFRF